jgi:hypothetical protein
MLGDPTGALIKADLASDGPRHPVWVMTIRPAVRRSVRGLRVDTCRPRRLEP